MAEITLDRTLVLLSSEKQRERSEGLADLKHILQQNKRNSRLSSLNDKACHKIFESLFRFISSEKSLYNRGNSKGPSASRLSTCASVLRLAVDALLHNLRAKSVRAVVDHITETLQDTGGSLFELLGVDYTKCLTALLNYPPHVEHLGASEWEKLMGFCLKIMNTQDYEDDRSHTGSDSRSTLDDFLGTGGTPTPSRSMPTLTAREKPKRDKGAISEAVVCIQLLTASVNAPVQEPAAKILHGLVGYVKSSHITGSGHQSAFNSINSVIMRVLSDQSELVQSILLDLIPVICHLWATKLVGLKDELLVTIMLCIVLLTAATRQEPSELLSRYTEDLLGALYKEYIKRPEKDILQVDELVFHQKTSAAVDKILIWPRLESGKSEHNWTVIWAIANLVDLSEEITARSSSPRTSTETLNKRQRLTSMVDEIHRDCASSSGARRVCALQLIPLIPRHHASVDSKSSLLLRLLPNILDENGILASWTMITIASLAGSPNADSPSLRAIWQQAWELTCRASTSQATSRASCILMNSILEYNLLEYSIVAEATSSMLTSVNLNGPSTMSDASLTLWATTTRMTARVNPGSLPNASKQICAWLREVWVIGTVTDRTQLAQLAAFARPLDLLNLLLACTNRHYIPPKPQFRGATSLIAKGWHFLHRSKQLLNYLFQLGGILDFDMWDTDDTIHLETFPRQDPNDNMVLDLLQVKSEMFLQAFQSLYEDKSHHVTVEIVQIVTSFCILVALYTECLPHLSASKFHNLQQNCERLWEIICTFLASHELEFIQGCLVVLSPFLNPEQFSYNPESTISKALLRLVIPLVSLLEAYRRSQRDNLALHNDEPMDLDDTLFNSKDRLAEVTSIVKSNREALPLFQEFSSFQRCITIQLSVLQKTNAFLRNHDQHSSRALVEYLIDLDEVDILAASNSLPYVYRAISGMDRTSLLDILEDLAEKCLQTYELERCEASHLLCIHMMHSFVKAWVSSEADSLSGSASDIYTWFRDVLLAKDMASPSVLVVLSELLVDVINTNASYSSGESNTSPRTSLLKILEKGSIPVKFDVGNLIPRLFGHYSLNDHDAIFNDVLRHLPKESDWVEGIALRLFILGQLASRWHTLLRRSIYHMFETPAHVPHSLQYAEKCICDVANKLGLKDAKELFRLFSSQILYTWTEQESITAMPFSIFSYASIKDMLGDVQDELVGQIIMRAREDEEIEMSKYMGKPFVDLLATSFYKAEAYSIARDISTPPGQGSQPKGVETRLKKILGTEQFMELIDQQFPQTIAAFFGSLDQYEQVERALSKRAKFHDALDGLRCILGKSASKIVLPANQQPSFRARYLIDELEFLCKRSGYELETIWTPTLASYVCRTLLESIHPALGSFHACSVIRKIRVLLCVAGSVMLRDYPFEMTLHAMLPFLVDIYCSEDALGIFWYLLEAGQPYLAETPGLMAGVAVSTLLSLKKFLASPPVDTAQQGQSKIVTANIERFLQWFGEYINTYESSLDAETQESFRRVVKSSQATSTVESHSDDSNERDVILEILDDRSSERSLLSKTVSDHVIALLCADSEEPLGNYHKLNESDRDATANIVAIYQTLQSFNTGSGYRLWAAKVIGRAFATTGKVCDALLREQDLSLFKSQLSDLRLEVHCYSKASILQELCNMLQNNSHLEVGLVERTLQLIISNLARYPDFEQCAGVVPLYLMKAFTWDPYQCPPIPTLAPETERDDAKVNWQTSNSLSQWARGIALFLSKSAAEDPVIGSLSHIIYVIPELAVRILPYMLHDVLLAELKGEANIRQKVSQIFKQALCDVHDTTISHARLAIDCILYLRNQPKPNEATIVERDEWLEIDFAEASLAASRCRLPKTALIFLEIHASRVIFGSRRSSLAKYEAPPDMLHDIFKDIDDPDFFYGIQQSPSLDSVMERLQHESSGFKNLLFQSAQYDSEIQMSADQNAYGVLKALNSTNLQGIANSIFSASGGGFVDTSSSFDSMLQAATNLRQWDIPVSPLNPSPPATVFRAFQSLNTSGSLAEASKSINECLLTTLESLTSASRSAMSLRTAMRVLGVITEVSDVLDARSTEEIDHEWQKIAARDSWLKTTSVHEIGEILNSHEALFSSINRKSYLRSSTNISDHDAQLLEVKAIRQSLHITRTQGIQQASLKSAVYLSKLAHQCSALGINIEGAAKFDLANVLWDQGEMTASIRMLHQLKDQNDLHKQAVPISRAELLVTLGHHVAEARLEKPETIIQDYLLTAVKELKGRSGGEEAGRVYHGFATFCDQQLQNPDGLEDFTRVEQLRNRKEKEVRALEDMMKAAEGREREALKFHRGRTKQWFDLDDREYQRLRRSREAFLQQCLENYLLCLRESETYNNDVLRFCALWLDKSDSDIANAAVSKHLGQVPSRKFAPLMNQLTSRLLDVPDEFQKMLFSLITRICVEHPFHGMYQIFASSKSKGGKDETALSRNRAAGRLVEGLKNDKRIGPTWVAVHNTNINYVRFAIDRPDEKLKSGARVPLRKLQTGGRLEQDAATQKLPPPTMNIEIRVDCDYRDVPKLVKYHPEFTIASGVSAPKIVSAFASNGLRYKQLFKGGNDDLRQDAIMEQVFEQVSNLLKDHQATRQRNLGIRTYKVLPLTSNAGIIEFVPHTIPLHDYLMPAHQKYYPKDMKPNVCRKHISDVQTRSFEQRVRTYRQVTEHFHPVMKYFFMEKFNNPDDWFSKRLSYTRSTAAISILGHVLGLGDRHGHNILLDERTGEVVHIDLGVAFEQGRVLPVPEVVPFRLTRDLVDGMGVTKTEGVFRRCCEFTLETLRRESYSIMTILDVLRYDPLYSWTVSPLRMKKMQDASEAGGGPPMLPGAADQRPSNEPSEADRALTVVAKKLGKTLSVTATVNELIQQATDEKNLAVLYCGWAAYA
ncbi:Serine/threonine-protein kinase tel1 [Aspergillus flavus]|uniref:Serine/threonine-protein kinase Tel1 n=1 Tax=Aspergillus flavus TaxID=5059 RepID=A0AB74CNU2_ASPFL|nr:serine/threonine-protein kinase tel1 [Aspergillus flavus]RAQ73988.1 serine/threonine-protein kinase tel1 [Aspergillus flavus]RMZ48384.1 serine/threonine-protein kinase tel1 [Aspergillus flavus]UDD61315.1 Serine/threonine-protein kinase tel1 [Aspergillus flavus]